MRHVVPALMLFAAAATPAGAAEKWKCSAAGLIAATYTGGATAYIHLSPFAYGGNYKVTKKGSKATGVTANGTRFTCSKVAN